MITFHNISFKNFFSVANNPIKYDLDCFKTTLLLGKNGNGKSLVIEALTFALFGKPFRKITKTQIVNSLNGKDCLVTLNLTHNGKKYKIKRGIKPNLLEITIDGKVKPHLASVKEEQDWLERTLQLNYKTFTHIVVLGNCNYTPFMEKSASDRRLFIEDVLGLSEFSEMKQTTKEKIKLKKEEIKDIQTEILNLGSQKTILEHSIRTIETMIESQKEDKKNEIKQLESEIFNLRDNILNRTKDIEDTKTKLNSLHDPTNLINSLNQQRYARLSEKEHYRKLYSLYNDHNQCPNCKQEITLEHQKQKLSEIKENVMNINSDILNFDKQIEKEKGNLKHYQSVVEQLNSLIGQNKELENEIRHRINRIKALEAPQKPNNDLGDLKVNLDALTGQKTALEETLEVEKEQLEILEKIESSYEPVKLKTIKTYIPIINNYLNKFLKEMNLDATFNFDEDFKEVIKTKYKEDYSYASFSEGEKMRINLALLLTWREVCKLKNSFNSNLLILDEVCDSSLDYNGMTSFLDMVKSLQSNTIIISHRDDVTSDDFDCVIKVLKKRSTYLQKGLN